MLLIFSQESENRFLLITGVDLRHEFIRQSEVSPQFLTIVSHNMIKSILSLTFVWEAKKGMKISSAFTSLCLVSTDASHQGLRANFLIWHSRLLSREKISFLHSNTHCLGQIAAGKSRQFIIWSDRQYRIKKIL